MIKKRDLSVSEYITNALFELMAEKPYNKISITEITDKANVHRVSFYRCFSSKEEIITKWIRKTTDNFLNNSNISYTVDCLEDYFFKLFTHLEKYKIRSKLIYQANQIHLLKNEFDTVFMKCLINCNLLLVFNLPSCSLFLFFFCHFLLLYFMFLLSPYIFSSLPIKYC